jgi:hypothetical protein
MKKVLNTRYYASLSRAFIFCWTKTVFVLRPP